MRKTPIMMNKEIKKLWIDALRSGSYYQGQVYLRRSIWWYSQSQNRELRNYYCPLGVLCDLHSHHFLANWYGQTQSPETFRYYRNDILPPPQVLEWAGLSLENANYIAYLSDTNGDNFDLIATYIEHSL
jgi:hypothetical protein